MLIRKKKKNNIDLTFFSREDLIGGASDTVYAYYRHFAVHRRRIPIRVVGLIVFAKKKVARAACLFGFGACARAHVCVCVRLIGSQSMYI